MKTEQEVIDAVRRYIKDAHPGGIVLEVVTQGVRHEQEWWYVPVRPNVQPMRRFEYYEALAGVERELQKSEHLTVLLVPTVPDAELAAV
jgi:hypothetical protein